MKTSKPANRQAIRGMSEGEDVLMNIVTALASELVVTRERLDTLERVLASSGCLSPDAIDTFAIDQSGQAERDQIRKRIIEKVFHAVTAAAQRSAEAARSQGVS